MHKIMIVDDDEDILAELRDALSPYGYDLITVNDSGRVVDSARKFRPNIVLLDIKMDGMNGLQIKDRLNQLPETMRIPVVAMTGIFTNENQYKLMQNMGLETCLKKPFTIRDLLSVLEKYSLSPA